MLVQSGLTISISLKIQNPVESLKTCNRLIVVPADRFSGEYFHSRVTRPVCEFVDIRGLGEEVQGKGALGNG